MCKIMEELKEEGLREGRAEGRAEGRVESKVEIIRDLMSKLHWPLSEALEFAKVPKSEWETYEKLVRQ